MGNKEVLRNSTRQWHFSVRTMAILILALAVMPICLAADMRGQFVKQWFALSTAGTSVVSNKFVLCEGGRATPIYVAPEDSPTTALVGDAFARDIEQVAGVRPEILSADNALRARRLVIFGTIGHSPLLDRLRSGRQIDTSSIEGKWESAVTAVVKRPFPGVESALVIAGSDRRGTAFAVFDLSRRIGVSPWNWWADVPAKHSTNIAVDSETHIQGAPSVKYRGIFLNDEDWGLRPWAANKMDPKLHNIGPRTYARICELLLRLRANTLWPAMHPGTLPFNAVPDNPLVADRWGIVMGSSHSEALLRNNVSEWNERQDGPWNYQLNSAAIVRYWDKRLKANGEFENVYTVGMRGVHDSGLEASGSPEVKAKLMERIISEQQRLLANQVNPNVAEIPQVVWLYKEVLGLYRVGMKIPEDVTLGWSDDNYGYIRELPNQEAQKRQGGSALYYHISYWGEPHDYLWLCTTPPALMREELSKAWEHGVRKMWILNVGDLKPAEMDIDYFLQMAWDEPATARLSQHEFLVKWNKEQFPPQYAAPIADLMEGYFRLNFARKPEFMGFNENGKPIDRTAFNPLAWGDQNRERLHRWQVLSAQSAALGQKLPPQYRDAYFELTDYPIQAAAAQNAKFLWNDRSYLDVEQGHRGLAESDAEHVAEAYRRVQSLTLQYNHLAGGKWDGIMSSAPRRLGVFALPLTAQNSANPPLPKTWNPSEQGDGQIEMGRGFAEKNRTISIDAIHFHSKHDVAEDSWQACPDLGLPGGSVYFGQPGRTKAADWADAGMPGSRHKLSTAPWVEYSFTNSTDGNAALSLYLLPTFPVDSEHHLTYAVTVDGGEPRILDAGGAEDQHDGVTPWALNVLRNAAIQTLDIGTLHPGRHTLRLIYGDPGVVFQHLLITFPGAPPAYPFPPETVRGKPRR